MGVQISLEIPIAMLEDVYPLTDFGFTLAHMALRHQRYREFYKWKPQIMDNGMYELGEPMTIPDLLRAFTALLPQAIIAPDWMDDPTQTSQASLLARNFFQNARLIEIPPSDGQPTMGTKPPKVAVVVQGKDLFERMEFFEWCRTNKFSPICFPFRNRAQRRTLIGALASDNKFHDGEWYHLLGLNNADEISLVKQLPGRWSLDTAKPCKPDLNLLRDKEWVGKGKVDLIRGYTKQEVVRVQQNVAYLRELCD